MKVDLRIRVSLEAFSNAKVLLALKYKVNHLKCDNNLHQLTAGSTQKALTSWSEELNFFLFSIYVRQSTLTTNRKIFLSYLWFLTRRDQFQKNWPKSCVFADCSGCRGSEGKIRLVAQLNVWHYANQYFTKRVCQKFTESIRKISASRLRHKSV